MRADLGAARDAERDVAVLRFEAREPRLKVPVVVHDRAVRARRLDLMRRASLEKHVSGRRAHSQAVERRVTSRRSARAAIRQTRYRRRRLSVIPALATCATKTP